MKPIACALDKIQSVDDAVSVIVFKYGGINRNPQMSQPQYVIKKCENHMKQALSPAHYLAYVAFIPAVNTTSQPVNWSRTVSRVVYTTGELGASRDFPNFDLHL